MDAQLLKSERFHNFILLYSNLKIFLRTFSISPHDDNNLNNQLIVVQYYYISFNLNKIL